MNSLSVHRNKLPHLEMTVVDTADQPNQLFLSPNSQRKLSSSSIERTLQKPQQTLLSPSHEEPTLRQPQQQSPMQIPSTPAVFKVPAVIIVEDSDNESTVTVPSTTTTTPHTRSQDCSPVCRVTGGKGKRDVQPQPMQLDASAAVNLSSQKREQRGESSVTNTHHQRHHQRGQGVSVQGDIPQETVDSRPIRQEQVQDMYSSNPPSNKQVSR